MTDLLIRSARTLWPDATAVRITRDPRGVEDASDHLVVPGVGAPRWLLPIDAPVTAAALVDQDNGIARRLAARLAALVHRSGLSRLAPLPRLRVHAPGVDALPALVSGLLGQEVTVAVRLGAWSHARSLVLRAFDDAGHTVAFGKVGIDEHGRASVRAEHRALREVAALDLPRIAVPTVLAATEWRGTDVLLVAPLIGSGRPRDAGLPDRAMTELCHASGIRTAPLGASAWADSVEQRLCVLTDRERGDELARSLRRLLATTGSMPLPLARWHGDWTPWNMRHQDGRIQLWDWEHSALDVPVGFDAVHYLAQDLRVRSGTGADSERIWRSRVDDVLRDLAGLRPEQSAVVAAAYLLEVNLRYLADRQGTPQEPQRRQGWGPALLADELRRVSADHQIW